ncbi:MAG: DUF433 domain-containing protein [Acidobacteria bacterium]|nr:DUF433 domain-containing protein [Acidobacteriota bacterium]
MNSRTKRQPRLLAAVSWRPIAGVRLDRRNLNTPQKRLSIQCGSELELESRIDARYGTGGSRFHRRSVLSCSTAGGVHPWLCGGITGQDVLSYLAAGMTQEQILADFPYLEKEDILACLAYAADSEKHSLLVR